ncbi:hypothetical protein M440DRAFT_335724 [Trichoderma longibrachiatum ATCC 18648]|uniref:Uncharacterized protein n=1 Tax=Trichoderma longibrachiatum ATCC 18648 TaxID=983965 RepID=A0A2T4C0H3_TRILO|nr:hypothetical protein M440DRAFT_335724 [Trichoderma longibrachiatum ATCC 18648]
MDRSRRENAGKLTPKRRGRGVWLQRFAIGPLLIRLQVGGREKVTRMDDALWF